MSRYLTTVVACLMLVGLPTPAQADLWRGQDPRGDSTAYTHDPEPPPCGTIADRPEPFGDITRLQVRHRLDTVRISVRAVDLPDRGTVYAHFPLKTADREYEISVSRWRGKLRADLTEPMRPPPDGLGECDSYAELREGYACRDLAPTIVEDVLKIEVPRTCLSRPRWVRVGASIQGTVEGVHYYDTWAPAGTDTTDWWIPVYGPRVRSSR